MAIWVPRLCNSLSSSYIDLNCQTGEIMAIYFNDIIVFYQMRFIVIQTLETTIMIS